MKSAVLFLVFNRPDTTQIVFDTISRARPSRLYIAADGPRLNYPNDNKLCEKTRAIVDQINWDCDVKTLLRKTNLGCQVAVSSAINWFFENEDEGIILEDDVVPSPEFFEFCDTMLERYRHQMQVGMISGFNPLGAEKKSSHYFYSNYASIWGWATWRSRWKLYDVNLSNWTIKGYKKFMCGKLPAHVLEYFIDAYEKVHRKQINTWDYQWSYAMQSNKLLVIRPEANLISNIGIIGTHSNTQDMNHNIPYGFVDINSLSGPSNLLSNPKYDLDFYHYAFSKEKYQLFLRSFARKLLLLDLIRNFFKKDD
ncbi:glycosyltransferase family 2 protein [Polynucleobacter sp. HIN7]|uniref:glycosyltransferase family 2 protein n=1 Tax=Polynucleobacter sp. HIN7 TaxID=3047866 RepID=UPI002573C8A6|nr:glycosyltransferase family 2 protein [Polynucleobacter sp. HIN7]BEI36577.1 hemolytic protein HlpA [Polynucleobacter sp. HIN7]